MYNCEIAVPIPDQFDIFKTMNIDVSVYHVPNSNVYQRFNVPLDMGKTILYYRVLFRNVD